MAIPQISNPALPRDYSAPRGDQGSGKNNTGVPFGVGQAEQIKNITTATDRDSGGAQFNMERRDLLPLAVRVTKDPTLAVDTLKQLINSDLLATAKTNGYTELYGELETLSKSIYIDPQGLLAEITQQESQTTMFGGDRLFDILRQIYQKSGGNDEVLERIGNFLKAVNFAQNREEILSAVTSNTNFLAGYFSPQKEISAQLTELSKGWESLLFMQKDPDAAQSAQFRDGFETLRDRTLDFMQELSYSFLNNERTQVIIPLIAHNLSRFNNNHYMLRDAFSAMLSHVPTPEVRKELVTAFENFMSKMAGQGDLTHAPIMTADTNVMNASAPKISVLEFLQMKYAAFTNADSAEGSDIADNSAYADSNANANANNANANPANPANPANAANANANPANPANLAQSGATPQGNAAQSAQSGTTPPQSGVTPQANAPQSAQDRVDNGYFAGTGVDGASVDKIYRQYIMGDRTGLDAISEIIERLTRTPVGNAYASLAQYSMAPAAAQELQQVDDIGKLVDYLNEVLKLIPESHERQVVYENLTGIVGEMVQRMQTPGSPIDEFVHKAGRLPPDERDNRDPGDDGTYSQGRSPSDDPRESGHRPSSSLEELTDFIQKNINHAALKSINSFNASNLLQSLINAPGVFTPLAHFVIPLHIDDTRAFGELWVDNDSEPAPNRADGTRKYHLFLTFDVETVGRFEVDMYAIGDKVHMAFLHPEGYAHRAAALKTKIAGIIASSGYNGDDIQTGTLAEPHRLTQVFPKSAKGRKGLNISV